MNIILITFLLSISVSGQTKQNNKMENSVYKFTATTIDGEEKSLEDYKGKVLLIVNTASKCGFTSQYAGLQELYNMYKDQGFVVLGFPCNQFSNQEPGTEAEIKEFCSLNYNVTFPMFSKIEVNGDNAHPLYRFLKVKATGSAGTKSIKWNFTKFLIDKEGNVIKRYGPSVKPKDIESGIKELL